MLKDLLGVFNPVAGWRRRRAQRDCFHHEIGGSSWIRAQLIEMGKSKMFWCTVCRKHWFV